MKEYNSLIEEFSKLDNKKKKLEIRDEVQEIMMTCHKLCNKKDSLLVHEKMKGLDKEEFTDDEFLDGLYAYIISMKEEIAKNI